MTDYTEVCCTLQYWSDKAICFDTGEGTFWVPKSLIENLDDVLNSVLGDTLTVNIATWFCEKEGIF